MPTYVYECRACGKVFEIEQRISADALTDCDCGAVGSLRRLMQPVAVAFKGAGFHINDYAPKRAEASESKADEAPAAPADAPKADAPAPKEKPAEPAPAAPDPPAKPS